MKTKLNYKFAFLLIIALCFSAYCTQTIYGQTETDPKKWTEAYVEAISSPDWADKMGAFGWGSDMSGHKEFRDAYANYKAEIKHIVTEGDKVMVWVQISAKRVGDFQHDELKGTKPTGKELTWGEIWCFNVIDGKMSDWEMMVDGMARMKSAGVKCIPD